MTTNLDHVADTNGAELHRLAKLYEFPGFVKTANMEMNRQPGNLAPTVYADPVRRQFPCHTAPSTWLSALFFQEKRAELHPKEAERVEHRLNHYAGYWGIAPHIKTIQTRWDELHKSAEDQLPDSDFGYVWAGADGNKHRQLRMKNAMEVKVAAEYLTTYRDRLPWAQRHVIAKKILEKAARYGASLGDYEKTIDQQAGQGVCNPKRVAAMIYDRAKLAKSAEHREAIEQLANTVSSKTPFALDPMQLIKLAETVDGIDRAIGLANKYTDIIRRPEEVIFEATFKEARAGLDDSCPMTSGTIYDQQDFKKVALAEVQAMFGKDFAEEVRGGINEVDPEKMAEIAATLPRGDAELFDTLMSACNVTPITVKSASEAHGIAPHQFESLADKYRSAGPIAAATAHQQG